MNKAIGHLWYLSEDLAALSMFSKKLSSEENSKILDNIRNIPPSVKDDRRVKIESEATVSDLTVSKFVTQRSENLFLKLKINTPRTLTDLQHTPPYTQESKSRQ